MTVLNKTQAAKVIGVSRTTLYEYLRDGRISATANGMIDTAELLRSGFELHQLDTSDSTLSERMLTQGELIHPTVPQGVTDLVDNLREQIDDLKKTVEHERQEKNRLLGIVENSQRLIEAGKSQQGFWSRVFKR